MTKSYRRQNVHRGKVPKKQHQRRNYLSNMSTVVKVLCTKKFIQIKNLNLLVAHLAVMVLCMTDVCTNFVIEKHIV